MSVSTASHSNLELSQADSGVDESLYQVKLLAALRSGDPAQIQPFLTDLSRERHKSTSSIHKPSFAPSALHLAIRCGTVDTVRLLLSHRAISPNAVYPPETGTTPLHLAASIGRADIVALLLEQDGIDDTAKDANGKTCKDVARTKEVRDVIRDSRSLLTASYRSLLHSYVASPPSTSPPPELLHILTSPRARLVDLSYLDSTSGRSLLHEAAIRRDLNLIEKSVAAGADVFVRDRRGKGVGEGEGISKDDKVRVFLRQYTNQDTSLIEPPSSEPPALKGYLNKYTNVARGYGTRWFVLQNGILSYYRHQSDEKVASRGSISMKTASLKLSGYDKLRFEVFSQPTQAGSSSGQQKWYIKGNHLAEVNRWTQAIQRSIEWSKQDLPAKDRRSTESEESDRPSVGSPSIRTSLHRFRNRSPLLKATDPSSDRDSLAAGTSGTRTDRERAVDTDVERQFSSSSSSLGMSDDRPPHSDSFLILGNTISTQVDLTAKISAKAASSNTSDVQTSLRSSLEQMRKMIHEYTRMVQEREDWWKAKLEKEKERGALWEESLAVVVQEGDALEKELKSRIRGKSRNATEVEGGKSTIRTKSPSAVQTPGSPFHNAPKTPTADDTSGLPTPSVTTSQILTRPAPLNMTAPHKPSEELDSAAPTATDDEEEAVDTDEEDEFFDAIDSNNIPNLIVNSALESAPEKEVPSHMTAQYEGYQHLRSRLPIDADNRPPTSLWSVLKHSIGKDLTKISFPVFFNEPTSMLQRMAEDMEFTECLDAAAEESDPYRRIAFVAAFAMSNYSSTIGRIAKPFNPMLSETFEYVHLERRYRYVSEQVSHHPPISACWAESPSWHYFGEVDAQNKFLGKSFEIRPTGVAHANLLIPPEWGPNYPKATSPLAQGKVVEHYSWKKVTTNVSGFILGSPTIDHYGDMTVINHRTQDKCYLTFKPRGWRAKDSFEIYGRVTNAAGEVKYEIAGRWNNQLIARRVGAGSGILNPDVSISGPSSPSHSPEFILLWRNTEKPPMPFNLTPYAITLNDCPDTLKPYLCPTDCRLRPDQRAFELGKFDRANVLKNKQEEFQRATRKAREEGRVPQHKPRWFTATTEGDTGERVWEPVRADSGQLEYWSEREKAWKGEKAWNGVDNIFIDDSP